MTDEKQPYNTPLSVQKIIKLFFRIRRGFFRTSSYHVNHGYFIASLQTSCVREAKWLAAFIRMEFEKDMENILMIEKNANSTLTKAQNLEPAYDDELMLVKDPFASDLEEDLIMAKIRQRFDVLLAQGKSLIKIGIADYDKFKVNVETDDINAITLNK
jgi:hypothetical protein